MIIQKSSKVKNCFAVKRNTYKIYINVFKGSYYGKFLFCRHKNTRKRERHLNYCFHNKFTYIFSHQTNYIEKIKFASQKRYLFCLLTSRNAEMTQTDQLMPHVSEADLGYCNIEDGVLCDNS